MWGWIQLTRPIEPKLNSDKASMVSVAASSLHMCHLWSGSPGRKLISVSLVSCFPSLPVLAMYGPTKSLQLRSHWAQPWLAGKNVPPRHQQEMLPCVPWWDVCGFQLCSCLGSPGHLAVLYNKALHTKGDWKHPFFCDLHPGHCTPFPAWHTAVTGQTSKAAGEEAESQDTCKTQVASSPRRFGCLPGSFLALSVNPLPRAVSVCKRKVQGRRAVIDLVTDRTWVGRRRSLCQFGFA